MFYSEKSIYTCVNSKQTKLFPYSIFDLDLRAGNDYITIVVILSSSAAQRREWPTCNRRKIFHAGSGICF